MRNLIIYEKPKLTHPRMVLGFSGWMDGGEVSTGTVNYLIDKLEASKLAEIDPEDFFLLNFPGSMEIASLFRPTTKIENGILKDFQFPRNEFYYARESNLIFLVGKEPNFAWKKFSDCVFEITEMLEVEKIFFVGSVAGLIPHTREPIIRASVSREHLKVNLEEYNIKFTEYEGPSSIITFLTKVAGEKEIEMTNLVAEIPVYVQGKNPKGIEAITKILVKLLNLDIDLMELHRMSTEFEEKLDKVVSSKPALAEQIKNLEEIYDRELIKEMGDLEDWLKKQGIKLDE